MNNYTLKFLILFVAIPMYMYGIYQVYLFALVNELPSAVVTISVLILSALVIHNMYTKAVKKEYEQQYVQKEDNL